MVRDVWISLNGLWDYSTDHSSGKILVPFCIESALSGVGQTLEPNEKLIYSREFTLKSKDKKGRMLLHAGAIDQEAVIYVNDKEVARHIGGFTAFSQDISATVKKGKNTIRVQVIDNTDDGYIATGKQTREPQGIWYTPISGIWQTIWFEPVPKSYIEKLTFTPNIDASSLTVSVDVESAQGEVMVQLLDKGNVVVTASAPVGSSEMIIPIKDQHLWSPEDAFLYDVKVSLIQEGEEVDKVSSYAAMRKVSSVVDKDGHLRAQLNNKNYFMMGPLDQGWWPDGLYTTPSNEALKFDIQKTKDLGFNTIRKHIKIEPECWYYYCDLLGMLVWQDMPSGDIHNMTEWSGRWTFLEKDPKQRSEASMNQHYSDWEAIIDQLYNHPSIAVWVPYNEAWGQFNTIEVTQWTQKKDTTRLVNAASGGNNFNVGDIIDQHHYPSPKMEFYAKDFINVLGEYGGIGLPVQGHMWQENGPNWGYVESENNDAVTNTYVEYANMLLDLVPQGYSAGIYTQTTDVEVEVNGLMTYDRKIVKVDEAKVREVNQKLCKSLE